MKETNYEKYRGKCKEYVDKLCENDKTLIPVRGHYICWSWGPQEHWWAVKPDGTIVDPTIDQFPKPHIGEYIPFNGIIQCAECGKETAEEHAIIMGNYPVCSDYCARVLVGV